ncbi:MAG: MmcQ/YjbR family DNA-binding protein [Myxococcales bacterium]|nr:MmcQ/YjbR family DNA-binding protein [Myxococcales bacterium]
MANPRRPVTRPAVLKKIRTLCLSLPETTEKEAWGGPTFRVKDKMFAMYMDNHHGDGRVALWCKAIADARDAVAAADPERFFVPPYVGARGWLGVRLDKRIGWKRITEIVEHAYRLTAPKRLAAALDDR